MHSENEEIKRLLKLYLDDRANAEERALLWRYLQKRNIGAEQDTDQSDYQSWAEQPAQRLDAAEVSSRMPQIWNLVDEKRRRKWSNGPKLKYAASILVLLTAGVFFYTNRKAEKPDDKGRNTVQVLTRTTREGEKIKIMLPDSTAVYLAGGSTLSWNANLQHSKQRTIHLTGEAFFDVHSNPQRPFIIKSGALETQVLGTSFNVYAYPSDPELSVTVKTGKVAVFDHSQGSLRRLSVLTAGMELKYNKVQEHYAMSTGTAEADSWITNRFAFRHERLSVVLRKLERHYNVKFRWKGHKGDNCPVTVAFENKNIKEIMEQLKMMSGGRMGYSVDAAAGSVALWGEVCR